MRSLFLLLPLVVAHVHEFHWNLTSKELNPDGQALRPVIVINDEWPAPQVRVHKGDDVRIHVKNHLVDDTAVHFHGLFQRGTSFMDGASMVSQCPIGAGDEFTYEFNVGDQSGTYWYHSHSAAQYADGLRGAFIIEDDEVYDGDMAVLLSDWYHTPSERLVEELFRDGSRGSEPRIDSGLFNETDGQSIFVQPDQTYMLRLINVGTSATKYFYIEDHMLTIVEVDGVKVEPVEVEALSIATGQRYGVLLKTKSERRNYGIVQVTNIMMHKRYDTNWLVYGDIEPSEKPMIQTKKVKDMQIMDDFDLKPLGSVERLPEPNHRLTFTYSSGFYGEKNTRYYTMNSHPHIAPLVPTLHTVYSAGKMATDPAIYGQATNAFILNQGDVIELVVNSEDHMKHPFHLHGHNFQVLSREAHVHYTGKSEAELPQWPLIRDTISVPGNGHVVLRFRADNPGVWFFHCHTEWHAVQGLGVVFIEAPDAISQGILPTKNKELCKRHGIKAMGNAAGNDDMDDMTGEVKWPYSGASTTGALELSGTDSSTATIPTETEPASSMDMSISAKTKTEALVIYFAVMISVAGVFGMIVQRAMKRTKKRITELEG